MESRVIHQRKRMALKAFKIAVGSCMAIAIAEFFNLEYAASAGIIALLTVQDTRKDTIQLTLDRLLSFLLSVLLIFVCFHFPIRPDWINFGIYILLMVVSCYYFDWPNTISVNAVMGTHYLSSPDYSLDFALNELALILIGTSLALSMNWKMPSNLKVIREDIRKIEDDMQQVLRELAHYMEGYRNGEHIWFDLDTLETHLHMGLERAHEQARNTMSEADFYYIEYMEMRMQQCAMLQGLRYRVWKIREMPRQAGIISAYLEYLAHYVHEENIPDAQIEKLQQVMEKMKADTLPRTREEFENRAILYHVLMDLEEFLFVKRRFLEQSVPRPEEL
ncbi:MAG: hypothetical protein KH452_07750 [Clostridiales bacterium]|nr:hypothetical protein [Clostridiales bacterium]